MGKYLDEIMNNMCQRVGTTWDKINPKKTGWFNKYTWTEKEQDKFIKYVVDFLYNNKEARNEILTTGITREPKKRIKKAVEFFVFNYGWKINDKKNTLKVLVYECPKCKERIYSRAQHDYKQCKCNTIAVDGGHNDKGVWMPERLIGIAINAKTKIINIKVTEKQLYDDWNHSENRYGKI